MALPSKHLGAIEAERLDPDQHFPNSRIWDGSAFDFENFRRACCVDHDRFHIDHRCIFLPGPWRRMRAGVRTPANGLATLTIFMRYKINYRPNLIIEADTPRPSYRPAINS
jgi:hypothetical protein